MTPPTTIPSLYDIVLASISEQCFNDSIDHTLRTLPETLLPSVFDRCCQDGHLSVGLLMAFRPYFDSFTRLSLNQSVSQTTKHQSAQASRTKLGLNDLVLASILPRLTSLRDLDLTRNLTITRLSLPRPELLQSINLSGCRNLKDSQIAPLINQAVNLIDIDLSGAAIGDLTVLALSEGRCVAQPSTSCNTINQQISMNQSTDHSISQLAMPPSRVQRLNLSGCLVYNGLCQFLSIRPPLISLNVSQTWFGPSEFEPINLVADSLTDLNLEFAMKLNDTALINLHECKLLQSMNLSRNARVTYEALKVLKDLPQLNQLLLGGQDVENVDFSNNQSITELDLQRCVSFTDRVALTLTPLKQITHMSLQYTSLSNSFIPYLIRSFPNLIQLKLTRTSIDDNGIRALFAPWSVPRTELGDIASIPTHIIDQFNNLSINQTNNQSAEEQDHASITAPLFSSTLERLDIGGEKLTDSIIPSMCEGLTNFPRLNYLGIWTSSVTARGISPLLSQPRARSTYIGGLVEALTAEPTFSADSLYDDVDSASSTAPSSPRHLASDSTAQTHRFILDPTMNSSVGTYVLVATDTQS